MMNILFYFDHQINPERGGTERVSDLLAHKFLSEGYNVYYLSKYQEYPIKDIKTFFLPDVSSLISMKNISFVENLINEYNIDYIINQGTNGEDIYLFNHNTIDVSAKIISCLHFSVFEGLQYFKELLNLSFGVSHPVSFLKDCIRWLISPYSKYKALRSKRKRFRFIYKYSDAVVVLASQYKDDYIRVAGLKESEKLYSIPNPLTFNDADYHEKDKRNELLFVGRLSYAEKRVDRILKVWKRLQNRFVNWTLVIVGDGPDKSRLETLAKSLELEHIEFVGFCTPDEYYKRAKLFCLTSTHEGFPMVLLEAMQNGVVPVVFDSFGAAKAILDYGKNGSLISPFRLDDYAEALAKLMSQDEYRMECAQNCKSFVKHFSSNVILDYWKELFGKLSLK